MNEECQSSLSIRVALTTGITAGTLTAIFIILALHLLLGKCYDSIVVVQD